METLTVDQFKNAIETVIKDESYRKNMIQLRSVMRDEIESPLERAVWWTEHVLRHGGARHLHAPAANMSWAEYLELELVLILLLGLLIVTTVLILILRSLYKITTGNDVTIKVKRS